MDITHVKTDPNLLGPWFEGDTWRSWHAFDHAVFGLEMSPAEIEIFEQHTGRQHANLKAGHLFKEVYLICGRRGGKSINAAAAAVFMAAFKDHRTYLRRGENGVVMVIAADRKQGRVILRYIKAFLAEVPMLAALVESETKESLTLTTGITIEIHTANFRSVRGYTVVAAIVDEIAFLPTDESANPDQELLAALRPAMLTVPDSLLLCLSSPYSRRGVLWDAYQKYYGTASDRVLVWKASTLEMNPSADRRLIEEALQEDPAAARAEYLAEFRNDLESYMDLDQLKSLVRLGQPQLPFVSRHRYVAFCDPSGGRSDSMTLAIAHREDHRVVVDGIWERQAPFDPKQCVESFAAVLRSYEIRTVHGDRYGGSWPEAEFRSHRIRYITADRSKSEIYTEVLPVMNAARIELPASDKLINEFGRLERRTGRGTGRDTVDHAPNAHDDLANAVAGAIWLIERESSRPKRGVGILLKSDNPAWFYPGARVSDSGGRPKSVPAPAVVLRRDDTK